MRRVISLLLMPFCLIGQGVPHTHWGTGVCEPHDHASRSHVHLHGAVQDNHSHGHHAHHHGANIAAHHHDDDDAETLPTLPAFTTIADHDADAFYVNGNTPTNGRRPADQIASTDDLAASVFSHTRLTDPHCARLGRCFGVAPPGSAGHLPLYLANASLRI